MATTDEKLEKKYVRRLEKEAKSYDTETAHCDADGLLCDLLRDLGYEKVVEAYQKVEKWYA